MSEIVILSIGPAKSVLQSHGVDTAGAVVVRRKLRRSQMLVFFANLEPCLIGMEARQVCGRHRCVMGPSDDGDGSRNRWRRRRSFLGA